MDSEKIIKRALITEKADRLRENNVYQFEVLKKANKQQIKQAVEKLFGVNVLNVRTSINQGKARRLGRSEGYRADFKKATVTIKSGQKIELIEGV